MLLKDLPQDCSDISIMDYSGLWYLNRFVDIDMWLNFQGFLFLKDLQSLQPVFISCIINMLEKGQFLFICSYYQFATDVVIYIVFFGEFQQ